MFHESWFGFRKENIQNESKPESSSTTCKGGLPKIMPTLMSLD